jgi:hypothetical protein
VCIERIHNLSLSVRLHAPSPNSFKDFVRDCSLSFSVFVMHHIWKLAPFLSAGEREGDVSLIWAR